MTRVQIRCLAGALCALSSCREPGNPKLASESEAATVCATGTLTAGIDVSSFQGTIDWNTVAADAKNNIKFAFAKASEGETIDDADFTANWKNMKAAGIIRGAYHFFHSSDNGTTQADWYLSEVNGAGGFETGDLPPMLDWESTDSGSSSAQAVANAQAFITEIKAKTGLATLVYTDFGFFNGLTGTGGFSSDALFTASWFCTSNCSGLPAAGDCPGVDAPWSSWKFWQWSDDGAVSGVTGSDLDVFNGSLAQLQAYAGGTVTPTFAPPAQVTGNDAITLVNWTDKHMELFAKTPAGAAMHTWTTGTNDTWLAAEQLDTGADCGSAAAFWGPSWSYPELFSPLASGASAHLSWSTANGWTTYADFSGTVTDLSHFSTTVGNDDRVWVFALGSTGAIWTQSWNKTSSAWSGWTSLGGTFATGAGAITWGNGTIEIFATDTGGIVRHAWLTTTATAWAAWQEISGGIASRPVPVRWSDGSAGHAEVFARGTDNHLYVSDYDYSLAAGYPAFSVVSASTTIEGDPSATMNPSGKPQVFARSSTGEVLQTLWSGTAFPTLTAIGTQVVASDPFGWTRGDGNAEVFAIDSSGNLTRSYDSPSTGWTSWSAIGSGFDSCLGGVASPDAGVPEDAGVTVHDAGVPEDAGVMVHDAGVTDHDAGVAAEDAGVSAHDAGVTTHDAGVEDAGMTGHDAGVPVHDAGSLPEDAGVTGNDAGVSGHDAGVEEDAGLSVRDAGRAGHDAGTIRADAGSALQDSGFEQDDAGPGGDDADAGAPDGSSLNEASDASTPLAAADAGSSHGLAGCNCSSGPGSADGLLWFALAIGRVGWRRRSRSPLPSTKEDAVT